MSIQFEKTGIVQAHEYITTEGTNPNLMPNSLEMALGSANSSTGSWRLAGTSNMERSRVLVDDGAYAFQNIGIQTANDGSCYGIDSFPSEANTQYVISFDARIITGTEGYAGFCIYGASYGNGSYTKVDRNYYVTPLTTEWTRCWVTFTTNTNTTRNIYIGITTGETSVTTQMCRVKLEKGTIPTPWCPHVNDAIYADWVAGKMHMFDKKLEPNEIIEW